MQKVGDDFTPHVDRGQRGDQRRRETAETVVVWLITQRRLGAFLAGPDDDETEVTGAQVRDVITRLIGAGHCAKVTPNDSETSWQKKHDSSESGWVFPGSSASRLTMS